MKTKRQTFIFVCFIVCLISMAVTGCATGLITFGQNASEKKTVDHSYPVSAEVTETGTLTYTKAVFFQKTKKRRSMVKLSCMDGLRIQASLVVSYG
jgi:hypothetical protein